MAEKECSLNKGFFCRDGNCYLVDNLRSQAEAGGKDTPELQKNSSGGPFWDEATWNYQVNNSIEASNEGCRCAEEVKRVADELTKLKKEQGQIIKN